MVGEDNAGSGQPLLGYSTMSAADTADVAPNGVPLSILDLAIVGEERDTVAQALASTVDLARAAEANGYRRIWYAEHHNMAAIASAATSVLIAHVAAHTTQIILGSGGIMLPNHSPLTIARTVRYPRQPASRANRTRCGSGAGYRSTNS